MTKKKKEPTSPKKEPIVFTIEPLDEVELKEAVESSQKTLTRNYVALVVAVFTLMSLSVLLFFISQNAKQSQKQLSQVQSSIDDLNNNQINITNSIDGLNSKVNSVLNQLEVVNSELKSVNVKLNYFDKITTVLDTLEQRSKSN